MCFIKVYGECDSYKCVLLKCKEWDSYKCVLLKCKGVGFLQVCFIKV